MQNDPETIRALIADLGNKDVTVRVRACHNLVKIGEPALIPLVRALGDPKERVRLEVAKVLGQIDLPWDSYATPEIIGLLVHDLANQDGIVRVTARRLLVAIGKPTVSALTGELGNNNEWARWEAVKALGQIGDETATEALIKSLEDKYFDVRWMGAEALIGMGNRAIIPLLQALIKHADSYWLRESTHHVLHGNEKVHADEILGPVVRALEEGVEPSIEVSLAAQKALDALRNKTRSSA
jgi:HEAT repeat protein